MVPIAGVDGCKAGWLAIVDRGSTLEARVFATPPALLTGLRECVVVAVDIPIGLPDRGSRECDLGARKALGSPRQSSVFPAPVRPVLRARSRVEADAIGRATDGRGVGAQAWGIVPKVREWDDAVRNVEGAMERVFEIHPEVCFWALNQQNPMRYSKADPDGYAERRALLSREFPSDTIARFKESTRSDGAKPDDLLDALVALWTARRIRDGRALSIPAAPPTDSAGIRMAMWY